MSSTTPSTQAGNRPNTALLPTLGLGGSARAGNGTEGGGAAFSELLREKIAAPKQEAPKAASPAPAPAQAQTQAKAPTQPGGKARKAEAEAAEQTQAGDAAEASAEGQDQTAIAQDNGTAETQVDPRNRKAAKTAVMTQLKPGSEAAQARQVPDEPLKLTCAADEAAVEPAIDAGDDLPLDEAVAAGASVAQAILQMLNTPAAAPLKTVANGTAADPDATEALPQSSAAGASALPVTAQDLSLPATAVAQAKDAAAAGTSQLQLTDTFQGQALAAGESRPARTAEALTAPGAQAPAGSPGSFAAHLQALANPRSAQAAGSSSPAPVALAQPLHSPEFAPAMSARLALLAAEGVQQAQLQLNPAEMGPVSVQITVEGQQAQIAFHAVQADTRHVLEQSLPELAAALRDQGLTLSGGGVFEQSQQQAREQAQQSTSGSSLAGQSNLNGLPSDAELLSAQAGSRTPPLRSRGVLDLYA
ncbi:flagellar hook-length control protein FliK [Roseateles microcysteis]|uniref:flagellar hook-length control protein FliK n=1 Tax=Roseateles microcysteis TaxID=3119057 RepID=UPI002FE6B4AC